MSDGVEGVASEAAEAFEDVHIACTDGIGVVTIERPPVNAFRTRTFEDLSRAFSALNHDPTCRVVIVRSGVPGVFSAGADINEMPFTAQQDVYRMELTRALFHLVLRAPQPVIAALNGPAIGGGCVIAAASDFCIATENASLRVPEITVARCGAARHLMRVMPQAMVRRAYFTGQPISAEEAHRVGMVTELVPDTPGALDEVAHRVAAEIARMSPTAIKFAKEALDLAEELPIEAGYHVEQQFTLRLGSTPDAAEAAKAFREKRPPQWADLPAPVPGDAQVVR